MTEAAHQMASNPLAGRRKPGSVGLAAGPEIAIMDESGRLLAAGRDRRNRHPRRQCHRRIREQSESERRSVRRRLVSHRRSRRHG